MYATLSVYSHYQGKSDIIVRRLLLKAPTNENIITLKLGILKVSQIFNPKRPGRFCNFSKNWIKKFKLSISPQLRVPEKRTIARLKGLVLGFHFGQVNVAPVAARSFIILVCFSGIAAARGLVVTTEFYWDLLRAI